MAGLEGRGDGWWRYSGDHPEEIEARFARREGRLEISELLIRAEGGVSSVVLRRIPLGQLEALANSDPERIDASLGDRMIAVSDSGVGTDRVQIRRRPGRLKVPETRKYPDQFYLDVARLYLAHAARVGRGAAKAVAQESGVPLSTAHRWVKEARQRGLLPPGVPGRSG